MSDGDRDDKPEKFTSLLGPEPTWLTCSCGAQSMRAPCWDCDRQMAANIEASQRKAAAIATIPARYAWAHIAAPELAARVKLRDRAVTLIDTIRGALAASRVVFAGPSGSGKTSLAIACLRERVPYGLFVSALKLGVARIQSSAGDGEAALVERAIAAPLLLIDEVGGEIKMATNAVRDVIFARYESDLPTWITTGFRGAQLAEMYGDGSLRRLTEDAYVVNLGAAAA